MKLNELQRDKTKSRNKRLGRGIGSGKGKTSGRGHKGQKSRAGASIKGFEGGQMPLYRRLPKRGFSNRNFHKDYHIFNIEDIEQVLKSGKLKKTKKVLSKKDIVSLGLVRNGKLPIKMLGRGEMSRGFKIEVDAISKTAREKVEEKGGEIVLLGGGVEEKGKD